MYDTYLLTYPWGTLIQCTDIEYVYQECVIIVQYAMSLCVPAKTVSIGPNDPEFITPLVKVRNKLRKKGRVTEADELAQRINHIITDIRSNAL